MRGTSWLKWDLSLQEWFVCVVRLTVVVERCVVEVGCAEERVHWYVNS